MPGEFAGLQSVQGANEIPVDVIGMILVFGERAVGEDIADAHPPELLGEDLQIVNQLRAPRRIP